MTSEEQNTELQPNDSGTSAQARADLVELPEIEVEVPLTDDTLSVEAGEDSSAASAAEPPRGANGAADKSQHPAAESGRELGGESQPQHATRKKVNLDTAELEEEFLRERQRTVFFRVVRNTFFSLAVVAAVAVLIVTLVLPILQISGDSMNTTLEDQDIVVTLRGSNCETGDVIAFYYNNKILVKRVIASSGQWVDIDDAGNVYVDGVKLDEPYVTGKSKGECNIKLPYQVPENRIFVMGDHRAVSVDSRSTTVGCVADEQIVGKLVLCAWPLNRFGPVH